MILDIIGQVTAVLGSFVFFVAAIGVLRFRDPYNRLSATGMAAGLGVTLVVLATLLMQPSIPNAVKAGVIVPIQLVTAAVAVMAIARSSYLTGVGLERKYYDDLHRDELAAKAKDEQ